jgi:membrane fusion protein (multidrug efflux system)
MADEKATSRNHAWETGVVAAKPAEHAQPASNNDDHGQATTPKVASSDNSSAADPRAQRLKKGLKKFIPVLVLLLAAGILFGIAGGWNRFVGGGSTQRTDDAYLRADITPLSTRVSGSVAQVAVSDYQRVKAGDLLVQLKDDDFKAQVAQAEAGVAAAQQRWRTMKAEGITEFENNASTSWRQAASAQIAQAGRWLRPT